MTLNKLRSHSVRVLNPLTLSFIFVLLLGTVFSLSRHENRNGLIIFHECPGDFCSFDFLSKQLEGKAFLTGDGFTVADGYLFTVLGWTKHVGIDLAKWPVLTAYVGRVAQRPAVQAALKAEGLAA